ncbi:NUDIX hydrolase [Candidatus Micrarchaeota archaeon]|nr:NUDIX hydrolase [Candidatus Micrarchaeota archaeon]
MRIQEINVYAVPFNKEGKVLVLKRHSGFWEFPGGGVDWGEEPELSAKRELEEETSLKCTKIRFLGYSSAVYKKDENDKHSVYLIFRMDVEGELKISGEHSDARWVTPEELKFLKLGLNAEQVPDLI